MQHYTTIEESKHLLELGLNPESADMRYVIKHDIGGRNIGHYPMIGREPSMGTIPCWSLGALLELLEYPKVYKDRLGDEDVWLCKCYINDWREMHQGSAESTPIEAVYSMMVWLLEHRYLKKGE